MPFSLAILWYERNRYMPAVGAVAFSALLMAMQAGLLLGLISEVGIPVDESQADIWVGHPGMRSVDVSRAIPRAWDARLANQAEIDRVESYLRQVGYVWNHQCGVDLVTVIGLHLDDQALGPIHALTPELRARLAEPNTIVVEESELPKLGLNAVGDSTEINEHRVRLVGTIRWIKGMAGPYVFCSISTAQTLLGLTPDKVTYLLARCRNPADAPVVAERLRSYGNMAVYTSAELAWQSRMQWLTKSRTGIALLFAALVGVLVGTAVTSQTLYAATAASIRQFAVLEALGIPTRQMRMVVLIQALVVGLAGIGLAGPAIYGCSWIVWATGGRLIMPAWLLAGAALLTLVIALLSGLLALRSLRLAEPAILLR